MADALFSSTVAILNFVNGEILDRSPVVGSFTATNGASIVTGSTNVLRLDGINDYLLGPSGANYAFPDQFCIEVICKKTVAGSGNYDTALTTDTSNGSATNGWNLELGTTRGFTFVAASGGLLLKATTTINDGAVHHWCVRRGADGVVRLSKDGTQLASVAYSTAVASTGSLGVGRNVALTTYPFAGDILAVRITKGSDRYTGTTFTPDTAPFDVSLLAISGNVKNAAGANAARSVRAYREDSGVLVDSTTSNGTTGSYSLVTPHSGAHTVIAYPAAGESLPALSLRGVTPV